MKIIVAADSFKYGAPSVKVCQAIKRGIHNANSDHDVTTIPMADGGEGTAEIMTHFASGRMITVDTVDPLFRPIKAAYGLSGDDQTAYIDMASASGIQLLAPEERNPMFTTTFGTGLLIRDAINKGVQKIILGVGGSATNDAGVGMAKALGYRFFDRKGRELLGTGEDLPHIKDSYADKFLKEHPVQIEVLCDVHNPLFGPNGAAQVYARQKGASDAEIQYLDEGLEAFASIMSMDFGSYHENTPGAGAAGGIGYGAKIFLEARLVSGTASVIENSKMREALPDADFVFTGEGRIDSQTRSGKLISGICNIAAMQNVPVIGFCGTLHATTSELKDIGLKSAFSILNEPMDLKEALERTEELLEDTVERVVRILCD